MRAGIQALPNSGFSFSGSHGSRGGARFCFFPANYRRARDRYSGGNLARTCKDTRGHLWHWQLSIIPLLPGINASVIQY